jgi:cysteinyl-tRNA synthetase
MYVCGPTVYDFAHIGNARPLIVFDVLFRLLRHLYGPAHVTYVRNITDVDDKINARAAEEYPDLPLNQAIREVTTRTERQFRADVAALGCLPPSFEPRATEFISRNDLPEDMIRLIGRLIERGHAYTADGHVLFHVPSMADYGRLSNRSLDEMIAGARVEVAPYKRDPMDFVLWKPSKPGEPAWPSPWSHGRPGWHIECSAMAGALLGETFDIHGGGIDLIFPHHENEIAQSRCAHGTPTMARYWLHNGFLQVEGEKMSKSLGNFVTIRELLGSERFGGQSWPGQVLRLTMLKSHYREPLDWTRKSLEETYRELRGWANALSGSDAMYDAIGRQVFNQIIPVRKEIIEALEEDLNTPEVLTIVRDYYTRARRGDESARMALMDTTELLGLLRPDRLGTYNQFHVGNGPNLLPWELRPHVDEIQVAIANNNESRVGSLTASLLKQGVKIVPMENGSISYEVSGESNVTKGSIERLIADRAAARKARDFLEADRIRETLESMGIALKDSKDPATGELVTTWEVKR